MPILYLYHVIDPCRFVSAIHSHLSNFGVSVILKLEQHK